jgi:threonine/homoserine/homoserine lactone efflux protein
MTLSGEIFGLPIPAAGPVFATALVIHILCGLTAVIAGALAATARKRPGRHPRAGRVYLWALGGIFATEVHRTLRGRGSASAHCS